MKTCLTGGGYPADEAYKEIKENGQQKEYLVLCPEERAKGFVRPYRDTYRHVGLRPTYPLRDLTDEERRRWGDEYVKYEPYPEGSHGSARGHLWTQSDLDTRGCGQTTTMSRSIAETYAREPRFYGATFCARCGTHLPVKEFVWVDDGQVVGS